MRPLLAVLGAVLLVLFCPCRCQGTDGDTETPAATFASAAVAAGPAQGGLIQATFAPLRYTGDQSLSPTASLIWSETDWMLPKGSATTPQQWRLTQVALPNPQKWGSITSWTTKCGYLEWDASKQTLSYKVEVDGCGDSWTYLAYSDKKGWTASGTVIINVLSNNCVYANCQQPGCGTACKCNNQLKGTCDCGASKGDTGYARSYVYSRNSEGCYYKQIVGGGSTWARSVFSAPVTFTKVLLPISFGKYNNPTCLPPQAYAALSITEFKLTLTSDTVGKAKATPLQVYGGARAKGEVLPCLGGRYQVVLQVPFEVGTFKISVVLNDGSPEREVGTLYVLDQK